MYQPAEDSYLLQKFVRKYAFGRVLDIGTGSGIQALTAIENPNVKEVIAVDINENVVNRLNDEIKEKKLRKINVLQSDLFENVEGYFNLIIFNPPYLPQDKGIEDVSLYGGKRGWEISERFFNHISKYLFPDGKILFLFSSLTNRTKIEEIINNNLLEYKEIGKEKLAFEELFVYEIFKTPLLRELERKGIENIHYFTQGKRGVIFTGVLDKSKLIKTHFPSKKNLIKVAIKIKRKESKALERIKNEVNWLKVLNNENIGPRLLFYDKEYFVYGFVEGKFILDWIKDNGKEEIKKILIQILEQCFVMDILKVNKEEMHHPLKHIVIDRNNKSVLLDFERCNKTEKPKNVTQFIEFIFRVKKELGAKQIGVDEGDLRKLSMDYKNTYNDITFKNIIKALS
ncbi:MAG: methyltransferase [Nanoarchaeota archaeon]|nr:methyltransferase [Nanoarchaeota archaeon]MBU1632640.1 methyltransferase [Nanoarchaeota archaeon]MBU1876537.1 methyltransferase [Nanoarchaeota archaeon]